MTDDQLAALLDRACSGVASPAEGEQLRAAVGALQQQAEQARRTAGGLQTGATCDHRDPNRLGARPSDLATVCTCRHVVTPPIFGQTIDPMQQPPDDQVHANVQAVMERYVAGKYIEHAAAQEAVIEAYLAAGGITVTRTSPFEQIAAEYDTLHHLGAALARVAARDTLSFGQIGQLTGYPMVVDDSLPPGEVHLRPHPRPGEEP